MRYAAILKREGKATLAEFPDAPGCQTFAEQGESIAAAAQEALEGWLEAHLVSGDVPPRVSKNTPSVPEGAKLLWVDVSPQLATRIALRKARHDAGLTQSQLAKLAGVSQPQVAKLESPDANPTIETLNRVSAALGVRLIIKIEPPAKTQVRRATHTPTDELRNLVKSDVRKITRTDSAQRVSRSVAARKPSGVRGRVSSVAVKAMKTSRVRGRRSPTSSKKNPR